MHLSNLGKEIRDLRKDKKLSQEKLAKEVGISRVTLSKLENGYIANISIVAIDSILSILDYEIEIKPRNPFLS